MQDLVFFLGRFHVLALHVPIGLVILAVAIDWVARSSKHRALSAAAPFLWGAAAVGAVLTAVLGYMHLAEGEFGGSSASAHRLYGTLVAVACLAVWAVSAKRPGLHRKLNLVTGVALLALITVTGHYGGNLTHGSEYLVEYAPEPLRALAGLPERRLPATDLATADPAVVDALLAAGFLARQVSQSDPRLEVNVLSAGGSLDDEQLSVLRSAAAAIVSLDLSSAGLDDAALTGFDAFTSLTSLRLSNNQLTDVGVAMLQSLPSLEVLNLYGNAAISDASLDGLAALGSLRAVYLWETSATADGIARLRERRPDLKVNAAAAAFAGREPETTGNAE